MLKLIWNYINPNGFAVKFRTFLQRRVFSLVSSTLARSTPLSEKKTAPLFPSLTV
jgi:hypothetical protein